MKKKPQLKGRKLIRLGPVLVAAVGRHPIDSAKAVRATRDERIQGPSPWENYFGSVDVSLTGVDNTAVRRAFRRRRP